MAKVLLFTALILSIVVPFRLYFKGERTKKRYKVSLAVNAIAFFGLMLGTGLVMFGGQASAADAANTAAAATAAAALPSPVNRRTGFWSSRNWRSS